MIFRVYEHYDDNKSDYLSSDLPDVCFICYEFRTDTECCPTSLKTQLIYDKACKCDGWTHKQCLEMWYRKQKKCPICRIEILERPNNTVVVVNVIPYSRRIYLFVCNSLNRMMKFFLYCFFLCAIIEFYLCIAVSKNLLRDNYENYNYIPYSHAEFNNITFS
jgi:hypothetical protein